MNVKLLEIRDEGTCIPVLAVDMNPTSNTKFTVESTRLSAIQRALLARCGYPCDGRPNIGITHLSADGHPFCNDPYDWGGRTRPVAHRYIIEHWPELSDGDVIDVQFILGETAERKEPEWATSL